MDRAKWIASCAQSEEDRVLLARVYERIEQGQRRNIPVATCFLSPREQALCDRLLRGAGMSDFVFFGGFEGAERCVCACVPDYDEDWLTGGEGPVVALRAGFYSGDSLTHRDFLGSLMGLGIVREKIGDILVGPDSADLVVLDTMEEFLLRNWDSAGRAHLTVTALEPAYLHIPQVQCQEVRDTVSSLRLDAIASTGFRLARGKVAALIESGKVQVNWRECTKPDRLLAEGDTVSARGFGKFEVTEVGGVTKKGRTSILLKRYV